MILVPTAWRRSATLNGLATDTRQAGSYFDASGQGQYQNVAMPSRLWLTKNTYNGEIRLFLLSKLFLQHVTTKTLLVVTK